MGYATEHRRMQPVLEMARELDIATNPDPEAIYEPGMGGFQIWCTPNDKPSGWAGVSMTRGAFSKPCAYVASVRWGWNDDDRDPHIVRMCLSTDAYPLQDKAGGSYSQWRNRSQEIAWARTKISWLFNRAGVKSPPIVIT